MKSKKSAFVHSSTGYGKRHNNNKNANSKLEQEKKELDTAKETKRKSEENADQSLNSGFGDYLRSPEAVEMMKLFVFANSIMLIMTMAWPNIKEQYYMLMHWLSTFQAQ